MTAQRYLSYESVLMSQLFTPTGRVVDQPSNWTRRTFGPDTIARVFLSSDGQFKAYTKDEVILCHGESFAELSACL